MLLDWVNSGYLIAIILFSILYRVLWMICLLLAIIIGTYVYKYYLGSTDFMDVQTGTVGIHSSIILLGLLLYYVFGFVGNIIGSIIRFSFLTGILGILYTVYYLYTITLSSSIFDKIKEWFNSIPEKMTQFKIISSITALFSSIPILHVTTYSISSIHWLFNTSIMMSILNIVLMISSYFIYKSFPIDPTTNISVTQILWGVLALGMLVSSYFIYKGITFSQARPILIKGLMSILFIVGLLLAVWFGWSILSSPTFWIIVGSIIGGIIVLFLLWKLYQSLPDSIKNWFTYIGSLMLLLLSHIAQDAKDAPGIVWIVILIEIFLIFYLFTTYRIEFNHGITVQKDKVPLSKETNTSVVSDNSKYVYGILFYLKLDPESPDHSPCTTVFTSVLNYNEVPHVTYNASLKCLRVTMKQQDGKTRVMCDIDVPLQKWFSIYIGYDHGILDVFYNGKLVKSRGNVIPYLTPTTMTLGMEDGTKGEISNVMLFTEALTHKKIQQLSFLT